MWKVKLTKIETNLDKDNDYVELFSSFSNDDGRKFEKKYRLYIDELTDVSLKAFQDILKMDKDKLDKIDSILSTLTSKIGTDL